MTGLSVALNNALSGLNVNQTALAVLSQNISNANTAGYSKQVVNQQSIYLDGNGLGVSVSEITRKVDEYLVNAVQKQNSVLGQAGVISDFNDRIQLMLGKPGSQDNIAYYTDALFSAIQSLAQTPDNPTLQQGLVEASKSLASGLSNLASGLHSLQLEADKQIGQSIKDINTALANVKELNSAISEARAFGKSTADLEDKRDQYIKQIAEYMNIRTATRDGGALTISTASGITLLDSNLYELTYTPQSSATSFSENASLSALQVYRLDSTGARSGAPITIISDGPSDEVVSTVTSGKVKGWVDMRDNQIPAILNQLDTFAAKLRDEINALHNQGTGVPAATSYTGTRLVNAQDTNEWTGSVRIAILDENGQPVAAPYGDQSGGGLVPLTIDLSSLTSGNGEGKPTVQAIINEINQYYGAPKNKVQLGDLDNIRLATNNTRIPSAASDLNFDFDLSNLSSGGADFFVTGVTVKNDAGVDVAGVTSTIPSVSLASTGTYVTTQDSNVVTVKTAAPHSFLEGQTVYLSAPPTDVDGISAGNLGGFFVVRNVTASGFEITVTGSATTGTSTDVSNMTAKPPYSSVAAGEEKRTTSDGTFTADLAGNTGSNYFTVTANVAVVNADGSISTSQVSYRVNSLRNNTLNERTSATTADGDATLLRPTSGQALVTAMLVDENGNELPRINGAYTNLKSGYLSIRSNVENYTIAIDSLDSTEIGAYNSSTGVVAAGSSRGFSHYFELNNFFKSNNPTATGDALRGSALNMALEDRIVANPHLIATGKITKVPSADGSPSYVYERNTGDNSIINSLFGLGTAALNFKAARGLATTNQNFASYASSIVGVAAQQGANAQSNLSTAKNLMDGFGTRSASISGVNLDTELANTVIYQNAYTASARIITVTNSLFEALLQAAQ